MGHLVPWSRLGELLNHLPPAKEPLQIALLGGDAGLLELIALVLRRAGHRTRIVDGGTSSTADLCLSLSINEAAPLPSVAVNCAREVSVATAGEPDFARNPRPAEAHHRRRQTLLIGPIIRNEAKALQAWQPIEGAADVPTATWPQSLHAEDLALAILRVIETPEISEWRAGLCEWTQGEAFIRSADENLIAEGLPPLSATPALPRLPPGESIPAEVYGPTDLGALLAHWLIRQHRWRRRACEGSELPPVYLMGAWLRLDERPFVRAFDCAQGTLSFVRDEDLRPAFALTAIQGALAIADSAQSDTWRSLEDPARPPLSLAQLGPSRHAPLTPGAERSRLPLCHWFERGLAAGASEAELHSWLGFGIRNGVLT